MVRNFNCCGHKHRNISQIVSQTSNLLQLTLPINHACSYNVVFSLAFCLVVFNELWELKNVIWKRGSRTCMSRSSTCKSPIKFGDECRCLTRENHKHDKLRDTKVMSTHGSDNLQVRCPSEKLQHNTVSTKQGRTDGNINHVMFCARCFNKLYWQIAQCGKPVVSTNCVDKLCNVVKEAAYWDWPSKKTSGRLWKI